LNRSLPRVCALIAALALAAPGVAAGDVKIVHGHHVSIQDHPWQVAIFDKPSGISICGGAIRDSRHVVTAAHCVVDPPEDSPDANPHIVSARNFTVGYGSTNLDSTHRVNVVGVSVEPRYLRGPLTRHSPVAYDAAILTLARRIHFGRGGRAPQPIEYASEGEFFRFFRNGIFATGWGDTSFDGKPPADRRLRGTELPAASDRACRNTYGDEFVAALMFCAGGTGTDTCQGDSGGPATIDTDPGPGVDRELVGIISAGAFCGKRGIPGIYTWIQSDLLHVINEPSPDAAHRGPVGGHQTISGDVRVGGRVRCNPSAFDDAVATQFVWWHSRPDGRFKKFREGPRTITLPASTAGQSVMCDVRYETDGGFFYAHMPEANFRGPVRPAAR
jgi:trypsin